MNLHLSTQARWRGITCLWYGRAVSLVLTFWFLAVSAWLAFAAREESAWLAPYVLAAGGVSCVFTLVLRWCV